MTTAEKQGILLGSSSCHASSEFDRRVAMALASKN